MGDKKLIVLILSGVTAGLAVIFAGNHLISKLVDRRIKEDTDKLSDFEAKLYAHKIMVEKVENGEYGSDDLEKMLEDFKFYQIVYKFNH